MELDGPDTQPLTDEEDAVVTPKCHPDTPNTWAWLRCIKPILNTASGIEFVQIKEETIKAGRAETCQLQFTEGEFYEEAGLNYLQLSRAHFIISHCQGQPSIVDTSSIGTWVNSYRVGKGFSLRLKHMDKISVGQQDFPVFEFFHEEGMSRQSLNPVCDKYLVGNELGCGSFSVVREGYSRQGIISALKAAGQERSVEAADERPVPRLQFPDSKVALKILKKLKDSYPDEETYLSSIEEETKEISILKKLKHPCINKLIDCIIEDSVTVLVLQFAAGGDLSCQVKDDTENNELSEEVAKLQFYQISHALAYLHDQNISHRDLKLDNVLKMTKEKKTLLKLTDFGLSKKFSNSTVLETYAGTPAYMAPEIVNIRGRWESFQTGDGRTDHEDNDDSMGMGCDFYTSKADCWSLGVSLYLLLSGQRPFSGEDMQTAIMTGKFGPMTGNNWDGARALPVTETAKDVVKKLLTVDSEKRLSAEEVLQHGWITKDKTMRCLAARLMGIGDAGPANDENTKRKQSDHDSGVSENHEKRTRRKTDMGI